MGSVDVILDLFSYEAPDSQFAVVAQQAKAVIRCVLAYGQMDGLMPGGGGNVSHKHDMAGGVRAAAVLAGLGVDGQEKHSQHRELRMGWTAKAIFYRMVFQGLHLHEGTLDCLSASWITDPRFQIKCLWQRGMLSKRYVQSTATCCLS